jgi:hypothetical protein
MGVVATLVVPALNVPYSLSFLLGIVMAIPAVAASEALSKLGDRLEGDDGPTALDQP